MSCFTRNVPPLDVQLLEVLHKSQKPILPVGAYDIWHILLKKVTQAFLEKSPAKAAEWCFEVQYAETLLRAYLAVISLSDQLCPKHTTESLYALPTKPNGRPVEISFVEVLQLMNQFMVGVAQMKPEVLQKWNQVYVWSSVGTKNGTPTVQIDIPVDLTPSEVQCTVGRIPVKCSTAMMLRQPPDFIRDGYDAMLQTLDGMASNSDPVVDPCSPVQYRTTQDVQSIHQCLPQVYAERPNPWLETPYQKQVLCILTFYKLFTVRDQVLKDCEEHHWPRDLNARGFNIFHPQDIGPELVYQQCGVRLHMGDREHSRKALVHCTLDDLEHIFGKRDNRLKEHLSDRERRMVQQIIDFPATLLAAYLEAYRGWKLNGDFSALKALFNSMSSEACLNLRFFAVMTQCQEILGFRSAGQIVQRAYQSLLDDQPKVDSMPLSEVNKLVQAHLKSQGIRTAWNDKEKMEMEITESDIRACLTHLGFDDS